MPRPPIRADNDHFAIASASRDPSHNGSSSFHWIVSKKLCELEACLLREHDRVVQEEIALALSSPNERRPSPLSVKKPLLNPSLRESNRLAASEIQQVPRAVPRNGEAPESVQGANESDNNSSSKEPTPLVTQSPKKEPSSDAAGSVATLEPSTASTANEEASEFWERKKQSIVSFPQRSTSSLGTLVTIRSEGLNSQGSAESLDSTGSGGARPKLMRPQTIAPERAFVINIRRLIEINKVLDILHELIKSTAIAAITLAAAGSRRQFLCTVFFILGTVTLFAMHEESWDTVETSDLRSLLPLLTDDIDERFPEIKNPNRLLKALSFSVSPVMIFMWHMINLTLFSAIMVMWLLVGRYWQRGFDDNEQINVGTGHYLDQFVDLLITEANDGDVLGMQLTVATLMFVLHLFFEYLHHRETCAVFPECNGQIWDPRHHGTPFRYRFLGLPSMWFSSRRAYEDTKYYMDMAHNCRARRIYPQEFAMFALSGDEERGELRNALAESKLFSAKTRELTIDENSRQARNLNVDLCFFDYKLHHKSNDYPGEFHYFVDEDKDAPIESEASGRFSASSRMSSRMVSKKPASSFFHPSFFRSFKSFSNLSVVLKGPMRSNG